MGNRVFSFTVSFFCNTLPTLQLLLLSTSLVFFPLTITFTFLFYVQFFFTVRKHETAEPVSTERKENFTFPYSNAQQLLFLTTNQPHF
jgi:hypothetical protein